MTFIQFKNFPMSSWQLIVLPLIKHHILEQIYFILPFSLTCNMRLSNFLDARKELVLELGNDNSITLTVKSNNNNQQMWTRWLVDEMDNWFVWSNDNDNTTKNFVAAPDETTLESKGNVYIFQTFLLVLGIIYITVSTSMFLCSS